MTLSIGKRWCDVSPILDKPYNGFRSPSRCRASLFPHLLKLFTRAARIDVKIPYITRDIDQIVY